ncbi:MAG: hypothetical protein HN704_03230 [Bacteroidetes bacterium]|nr:hypothetical protein [Bacteroidota bacterium]MBT7142421.1 hypothetical protein [Bacteroidota bacterium]MBT7490602.1 hypothetical protein [Bacteroidota bacterium]
MSLSSCERGRDGRPGEAYISLDWEYDQPSYIDAGTYAIPEVFVWGRNYHAQSGYYDLYYEGSFWDGFALNLYAWEVGYEIWRNPGQEGAPGYIDGKDGPDSYLSIYCSPYGPYFDRFNKSSDATSKYKLIEATESEIVVQQNEESFSMKITYKKVEPREKE